MSHNVAIDGPAGAGKSTIAKRIARRLGYIYVDTGAMYRAMAYYLIQNQVDAADQEAIAAACQHADISICYQDGEQVVLLNGENVNAYLRTEAVGNMASVSSVVPEVRKKLVELQQKLARETNVPWMAGCGCESVSDCQCGDQSKEKISGTSGKR